MIEIKDDLDKSVVTNIDELTERIEQKLKYKNENKKFIYLYSQEELDLLNQPEKKQILKTIFNNMNYHSIMAAGQLKEIRFITINQISISIFFRYHIGYDYNKNKYNYDEEINNIARYLVSIKVNETIRDSVALNKLYAMFSTCNKKVVLTSEDFKEFSLDDFENLIHLMETGYFGIGNINYRLKTKTSSTMSLFLTKYIISFELNDIFVDLVNEDGLLTDIILSNIKEIYGSIESISVTMKK